MKSFLLKFRRFMLSHFIPEFIWPVSVNISGAQIPIRNEPYSFGTKWILKKKEYENPEIALVNEILKEGDEVLEMGTSIGVLTRVMSKIVGESGKLVSIECNEVLYKQCHRWVNLYPNINLLYGYGFPVYKVPDNLSIDGYSDDLGSLGTKLEFSTDQNFVKRDHRIIDFYTIEKNYSFKPNVLVIDVEGSEEIIVTGEFELPEYIQTIIIELHPGMYKNKFSTEAEIIKAIQLAGFNLYKKIASSYLFKRYEHN
ncbi:MAG: FkbM family methyltransferase [Sediminibacterium sp.]|nr:FkbM family methyltransferase [Sediminibacterium sp.]MBX9780748.1 hypothetical protein [Chitinophagaceae bacterium]